MALVWLAAVAIGLGLLWNYSNTPSAAGATPEGWPADSALTHADDMPTLLLFAHPRCPCTRASLAELSRLMARSRGRVDARVLFYVPDGAGDDWQHTDLWDSARMIPGVSVAEDHGGIEAQRFGAMTSGYAVLYDAHGALRFRGGITVSRGHEGDNLGRDALYRLIVEQTDADPSTPVYGCPIYLDDTDDAPRVQTSGVSP